MLDSLLSDYVASLHKQGMYRSREIFSTSIRQHNFSSNDYLGMAENEDYRQGFIEGFKKYPIGSSASMFVCGYQEIHQELEDQFCRYLKAEKALVFSSGYAANLAIMALIAKINAVIVVDKNVHASFYDGLQLASARFVRFAHNDLDQLNKILKEKNGNKIVVTEGLFSMSGQQPLLDRMISQMNSNDTLIVDESHSFGVLGRNGLGVAEVYELTSDHLPLRIISFGKSLAAQGAIVVGKEKWLDALFQVARSNRYSTALSPALTYGILKGLDMLINAHDQRKKLQDLVRYFVHKRSQSPFDWTNSPSPIQQLKIACPIKALTLGQALRERDILCVPMRPPTVKKLDSGLRIVINCNHTQAQFDFLFQQLDEIYDHFY